MPRSTFLFVFLLYLPTVFSVSSNDAYESYTKPAEVRIKPQIINPGLQPFTATIYGFGNSLFNKGGSFEPSVYRNWYIAELESPDRISLSASRLSNWNSLRNGYLDGADVRIYRINNGKFELVREDSIPDGGFNITGWRSVFGKERMIPVNQTSYKYLWYEDGKPGKKYYFTVRAIDNTGNLSAPASYLEFSKPEKVADDAEPQVIIKFKASSFFNDTEPPKSPKGFAGQINSEGALELNWSASDSSDVAGYIVYESEYHPKDHRGYYIELKQSPKDKTKFVKQGDLIIVNKKFYSGSRNTHTSDRIWASDFAEQLLLPDLIDFFPDDSPELSWRLEPHAPDTPVSEGGETYLKLNLSSERRVKIGGYNHSGLSQSWYQVLETTPYKVEVWLRSERESEVRFRIKGYYEDNLKNNKPIYFRTGPKWKKYTATFTPRNLQPGDVPEQMRLEFFGPGIFSVDNFRIFRADAEFLDYLPRDYQALRKSGIGALRIHSAIKTRTRTYDMEQFTNMGGNIDGTQKMNTLHQNLTMMKNAGVQPWLQIEPHMSPEEWLGFVEYMAAPFNRETDDRSRLPWAYKRAKQGQVKPWTEVFEKIYFEVANETWNRRFRPWVFPEMTDAANGKYYSPGEAYGLFQEYVIDSLRKSEHWDRYDLDTKFEFVLGGWAANPGYGEDAARMSPSSEILTIAGYNGGWDENEGPPSIDNPSFSNLLNQVSQSAIPTAEKLVDVQGRLNKNRANKIRIGTYEAGPGYVLDGLNNEKVTKKQAQDQEVVMKSLAAGTATIDSFLARAYRGFSLQNYFTFARGHRWRSHTKWYRGGHAHPPWLAISLFNNMALGDMLAIEMASVPTIDLEKTSWRKSVDDAPLIAVYATRKDDRYSVFVISRKLPEYPFQHDKGYTPVQIQLPFEDITSIDLYSLSGDMASNNLTSEAVKINLKKVPAKFFNPVFNINENTGLSEHGIPPASVFLYVFHGVSQGSSD